MEKLSTVKLKHNRLVIGQMSGTSLDGVDLALVRLKGSGSNLEIEPLEFRTYPYTKEKRAEIKAYFSGDVGQICKANYELGHFFGNLIFQFCEEAGLKIKDLDLIGLHGQTVHHHHGQSTLQIGEADVVARMTDTIVISDFRAADIAAGGCGAPLIPYLDYLLMQNQPGNIAIQNLGGIGNVTWLAEDRMQPIIAFDTGPANAILNEFVEFVTEGKQSCDKDGMFSKQGISYPEIVEELLDHEYFFRALPKSCGREEFGKQYVYDLLNKHMSISHLNLLRTAVSLIAHSLKETYERYLPQVDQIFLSGGGVHNPTLFEEIKSVFDPIKVDSFSTISSISEDDKESVAMAVFAHERINNAPCNVPSVTGAKMQVSLGKISIP